MAAKTKQSNRPVSDKPVVVVDDVHIIYKVFASGRRATKAGAGAAPLDSAKAFCPSVSLWTRICHDDPERLRR